MKAPADSCVVGMQIVGALIVAAGVCLAAAPSDAGASIFQKVRCIPHWSASLLSNLTIASQLVCSLLHLKQCLLWSLFWTGCADLLSCLSCRIPKPTLTLCMLGRRRVVQPKHIDSVLCALPKLCHAGKSAVHWHLCVINVVSSPGLHHQGKDLCRGKAET